MLGCITMPTLHIVTGPPGSGKTTHAEKLAIEEGDSTSGIYLPIYDRDLGNKKGWMGMTPHDAILNAHAPSVRNKSYWVDQAIHYGYTPKLYVMWIPRMEALKRMKARSGLTPTERNDLEYGLQFWYKSYSRHPQEERIENV